MRISIPIDIWDPARGGTERYLDRLLGDLARRGHEATVLCLAARGPLVGDSPQRKIETVRVPRFPRWLRELAFAREAVLAHRRSGRDVLFAVRHALEADLYQPHGGSFLKAREAALRARPRLERGFRRLAEGLRPALRVLLWLDREVFRRSPHAITVSVSRKVEEDFAAAYPRTVFRFERLHNAVDLERFHGDDRTAAAALLRSRHGIPPASRVALLLAHNPRLKGLEHAIAAVSRAAGWSLVVAGRRALAPFEKVAVRFGVRERVHFAGLVDDARPLLAGADALLLPTHYDPCSLATLEAVACGTPVVTTRQNGASEIVEPGGAGIVVESPEDEAGLSGALDAVAGAWGSFHEAALRLRPAIDWDRHVDRMEGLLERAAHAAADRSSSGAPPGAAVQ
ncbi:MAG TPA: glycosyltransferase family 4 protein [Planctomycetota bacterium]|nr:glycosyltransferase family 4 protein [Planctomycetota bacterium]